VITIKEVDEIFEELKDNFYSELAGDLKATFQFNITNGGKKYALVVADGKCDLVVGGVKDPSVEIILSLQTWNRIREGHLNSQMAFMQGNLKIKGDMNLAMKMGTLFPLENKG
jgi:putative sterol carrier protein